VLGSAIAYSSAEDHVLVGTAKPITLSHGPLSRGPVVLLSRFRSWLWGKCIWPYGCLGCTGWMLDGHPLHSDPLASASVPTALFTRWFSGGHSGYFAKATIARTFEQIYRDIKTAETQHPCL